MISEFIVILNEKQTNTLIKRAMDANYINDLDYLQEHLNKWLEDDSKRLNHTEKQKWKI